MGKNTQNNYRVIAGKWRSRKLALEPNAQLRPTPDRVRETLFNWLGEAVVNAHCLDLFAGSGSLGMEALSRGAASCDFVDTDGKSLRQVQANLEMLAVTKEQACTYKKTAKAFLSDRVTADTLPKKHYDIVFLDPPFRQNLIENTLASLEPLLKLGSYLYIEIEKSTVLPELPENWRVIRDKTAGQVRYHLLLIE